MQYDAHVDDWHWWTLISVRLFSDDSEETQRVINGLLDEWVSSRYLRRLVTRSAAP